jgi:hypothetical protein
MGEAPDREGIQQLSMAHGASPTHAMPMFVWNRNGAKMGV